MTAMRNCKQPNACNCKDKRPC